MKPLEPARIDEASRERSISGTLDQIARGTELGGHWCTLIRKPADQITREDVAAKFREVLADEQVFKNDVYQVHQRFLGIGPFGRMVHLSLRRLDRQPVTDWRDKQAIKNQLCGPEAEGIEIYPAESRVVDTANQYHLWVFLDIKLPFGFGCGLKTDHDEHDFSGALQRPFEENKVCSGAPNGA